MSRYFLFDMHTADISNSRIVDVVRPSSESPEIRVDGLTPIHVPDDIEIGSASTLEDVLSQKRAGVHARYPGFGSIVWDDMLDSTGLVGSAAEVPGHTTLGARFTNGGRFDTAAIDVTPVVVTRCVVVYEAYSWRYVHSPSGRVERYYVGFDEPVFGALNVAVRANPETYAVYDIESGSITTFSPEQQGSQLSLEVSTNQLLPTHRLARIGYWAIMF